MARLFVVFGSSLVLLIPVLLGGCDKIAGVAADGAHSMGNVISPVTKAIVGPSDERLNAQAICMKEAAARHPGRDLSMIDSSVEGSSKFSVRINFPFTPEEIVERQRKSTDSALLTSIYMSNGAYIECHTDYGVVISIE